MSKFTRKTNTFTITANENGTFSIECKNQHCSCLNYVGGSHYAVDSHLKKLIASTLLSMPENNCKSITFTITANDE